MSTPPQRLEELLTRVEVLETAVAALQREVALLRGQHPLPPRGQGELAAPTPRVVRPVEYWVEHLPDFGDGLTRAEAEAYLARPRVRAEDIELTEAERARRPSRPRAVPRVAPPAAPPAEAPGRGPSPLLWLLLATLLVVLLLVYPLILR